MKKKGLLIIDVFPDSLAEEAGVQAGDRLLELNGEKVLDQLNYQFLVSGSDETEALFENAQGEQYEVVFENGGDGLGLDLAQDEMKLCKQNCVFCFVQQMPKGFRKSLYLKDEDIRLSFLYGHFTTLSSSDDQELDRVIRERLSPIHVSVHATDPESRVKLMRNPKEGHILRKIDKLIEGGIEMHTQVVLVPGMNDDRVFQKTVDELWQRRATFDRPGGILSLSCVPVGLTGHRTGLPEISDVSPEYAMDWVKYWTPQVREYTKQNDGEPWLLMADEWYTRAGVQVPGRSFYSRNWSQIENGVGLIRRFLDHSRRFIKSPKVQGFKGKKLLFLTGSSFAPTLAGVLEILNREANAACRCVSVDNRSFGTTVTVAGLLCGQDLLRVAQEDRKKHGKNWVDAVIIPSSSVCQKPGPTGQYSLEGEIQSQSVFLDDMTLYELEKHLGVPVIPGGDNLSQVVRQIEGL